MNGHPYRGQPPHAAEVRDELLYLMREGKLWSQLEDAIRRTAIIPDDGSGSFTIQLDPVIIAYLRGLRDAGRTPVK